MAGLTSAWTIEEHEILASHPRGYRRGVRDTQTSRLRLHVKQYIPSAARVLAPNDYAITLIVQHGQPPGDNKEVYEPFLQDLLCQEGLPPVRAIWAMDAVSSGQSFMRNRNDIGDQHHWYDASRDVVQMVNHFQAEMRPPLIAFGQSWGAGVLTVAAASSPRLFQGVILTEPVFESGYFHNLPKPDESDSISGAGAAIAYSLARRKRHFADRAALEDSFRRTSIWKAYDPRVIELIKKHDYRDLEDGRVELIAPPSQTATYFLNPSPPLPGYPENEDYANRTTEANFPPGFYNAQSVVGKRALGDLTCPMLFIWEKNGTFISDKAYRQRLIEAAERSVSKPGRIQQIDIDGGHQLALQKPGETAVAVSTWLKTFWGNWLEEERLRVLDAPISAEIVSPALLGRIAAVGKHGAKGPAGRGQVKL
jgi:pimeloyl-ACP methyl ester carboxylesterase